MPRMRGEKWLSEATYLTDADRSQVRAVAERAKAAFPTGKVGIRPAAYTGEPHPIATVTITERGGEWIFQTVYRPGD